MLVQVKMGVKAEAAIYVVNVGGRGEDNIEGVDRHAGGRGPVAGEE
jgi:hypothetical protein